MKRYLTPVLLTLSSLALAVPAHAQDGGGNNFSQGGLALLGAGLGIGIAAGLAGIGQGRAVASATEATARNPGAAAKIQTLTLIGLAFIESLVIYALVISFLLMTKAAVVAKVAE